MTKRFGGEGWAIVSIAGAIGVFGVVYGATARPVLGVPLTILASMIVFSGTVQFAMLALLTAGAGPAAVLGTAAMLNLRNLALGAAIRPRLPIAPVRRVLLSWFLIDETVGLTLAGDAADASPVLARAGAASYVGWVAGTILGVAGVEVVAFEGLAAAVFPVLFVGLAAIMARSSDLVVRGMVAAVAVLVIMTLWPALGALTPITVAALVALPRGQS